MALSNPRVKMNNRVPMWRDHSTRRDDHVRLCQQRPISPSRTCTPLHACLGFTIGEICNSAGGRLCICIYLLSEISAYDGVPPITDVWRPRPAEAVCSHNRLCALGDAVRLPASRISIQVRNCLEFARAVWPSANQL